MRLTKAIIGLTIGAILPAKAANVEQYINQLPPRANLALMVQKVGTTALLLIIMAGNWHFRRAPKK